MKWKIPQPASGGVFGPFVGRASPLAYANGLMRARVAASSPQGLGDGLPVNGGPPVRQCSPIPKARGLEDATRTDLCGSGPTATGFENCVFSEQSCKDARSRGERGRSPSESVRFAPCRALPSLIPRKNVPPLHIIGVRAPIPGSRPVAPRTEPFSARSSRLRPGTSPPSSRIGRTSKARSPASGAGTP